MMKIGLTGEPFEDEEVTYGTEQEISELTEFDDYQARAMRTNIGPRVYTEQQVRAILDDYSPYVALDDTSHVDDLLYQHATPLTYALYHVLGACEEIGEQAGKFKKALRDDDGEITGERQDLIKKEIGDGLWYLSAIAAAFNWPFSEVAKDNLTKLADRAQRGVLKGSGDTR
ncbi:MAG: nucleoside triphosphate pyrophosphohydrolase family protein [Patescibacteria group bacterium]|nr:nucleoside triphosphate pyrophosphohydrolase family protein [Patescibacteria group bacterium]